jgi:hypothetical protein
MRFAKLARAGADEGVARTADRVETLQEYADHIPPPRPSLLIERTPRTSRRR